MLTTKFMHVMLVYLILTFGSLLLPLVNRAISQNTVGNIYGVMSIVCGILWFTVGKNYSK